jgi:hypothetical protein
MRNAGRFYATIVVSLLVSGCDQVSDGVARIVSGGAKTTVVILAPAPLQISPSPLRLDPGKPLEVVGTIAGVCLSLRGDLPMGTADVMNAEFASHMKGIAVTAQVTTPSGKKVALGKPYQSWSKDGKVVKDQELAACMRANSNDLPVGAKVATIEISSSAPLDVRGVYWQSTNAFDKPGKRS